jgi:hypothetical protein
MATKQGTVHMYIVHISPHILLLYPGSAITVVYLFCPRCKAHFHEMHSQKGIRDLLTKGRLRARKKPPKETIVDLG